MPTLDILTNYIKYNTILENKQSQKNNIQSHKKACPPETNLSPSLNLCVYY